jgi:SAM-dependent methyltransferase
MDHTDHVNLLRGGIPAPGGVWADLGSGTGAFTLALADLLGPGGEIYSVDRDGAALRTQEQRLRARFPAAKVHYVAADYARALDLPLLDGVVMANSLHFHRDRDAIVRLVGGYLRLGGNFILVEYNTDEGNPWVPYPLSYPRWEALATRMGFGNTRLLARVPSQFLHEIYSAVSTLGPY